MSIKIYEQSEQFTLGMTMKNNARLVDNNMAFLNNNNDELVITNRQKLAKSLGLGIGNFVCAKQTHSPNFYKVTYRDQGSGAYSNNTAIKNVDALYTMESDLVLCTFSADCVPIIFYHETPDLVGVIHSGWRGTISEITSHLFNHLIQVEHCHPHKFHVFIGAAISQDKFEVDDDVYKKFKQLGYADEYIYYNNKTGKYHIDNQQIVNEQCERIGIPPSQIKVDLMCTYLSEKGFSYRENKTKKRHLCFIVNHNNQTVTKN